MKRSLLLGCLTLSVIAGCRVGPRYEQPSPYAPVEWKTKQNDIDNTNENSSSETNEGNQANEQQKSKLPSCCYWWEIFQDEQLNQLELLAINNNPNLQVAMARVDEAWDIAWINRGDLYPHVNLTPNYTNTGQLFKLYLPPGLPISSSPADVFRVNIFQYLLPVNLSYELDLWGKYRSNYDSAVFSAEAQEDAFWIVILNLTSDVASTYFNMRTLNATIDTLKTSISNFQKEYELNRSRYEKGLLNEIPVNNALETLANTESQLEDAYRQRTIQENLMAALIGIPPSDLTLETLPVLNSPPTIPSGVPANILKRRPDIAQAERTMASENALIGVAYADYFPSLTLTGTLGFSSPDYKQFLRWISRYYSFGARANENLFDGGKTTANYMLAWARFREASWNYQQVVINAFREVEDALTNLDAEARQVAILKRSYDAANRNTGISFNRFKQGLINNTELLDTENIALNTKLNYVNTIGMQYQSTIQLIKALGGCWEGLDGGSVEQVAVEEAGLNDRTGYPRYPG